MANHCGLNGVGSIHGFNKKPLIVPKNKSMSARSNQSGVILSKTAHHVVESYGAAVPVQINETLIFSDRNTVCSALISNDGWAWFVIGRSLFIWHVDGSPSFRSSCRELTLPPCDLAYSAYLISVFNVQENQNLSCIAVSPDGVVRYWPNVCYEGISLECNAQLQGQECEIIKQISPTGFIVATTSAMLLLIETNNIGGRHSVTCRALSSPSSWLGGIGKKFSSIFFSGYNTCKASDSKLVNIAVCEDQSTAASKATFVFLIAGSFLQKWSISNGESEKLLYQCSLDALIVTHFEQTVWNESDVNEINLYVIDMQLIDSSSQSLLTLVVASSDLNPSELHYAFVSLNVEGNSAPLRVTSFQLLKNLDFSLFHADNALKKIYLLVNGQYVYLYNHKYIISTTIVKGYGDVDIIRLPETQLLGGCVIDKLPIFFSRVHGLISLVPSDIVPMDCINFAVPNMDSSTLSDKPMEESDVELITLYKDNNACMKAAFLYYVSKKINQASALINEVFPMDDSPPQVDATLDVVAIKVSLDLIDDIPARDPRWADIKTKENVRLNSTLSLPIQNQLADKQQALEWFVNFLKEMSLWSRLSAVTWNSVTMDTTYVFAEQAEKLIAAVVLKKQQEKFPKLLEHVIETTINAENMKPTSGLTYNDLFYRKVSFVHKALNELCKNCEAVVCREHNFQEVAKVIGDTNRILLNVLEEISIFRQEKGFSYSPDTQANGFNTEMLSWTAASGPHGIKDSLMLQSSITLKYGINCVSSLTLRRELINQLISLNSIILEGWKINVESVSNQLARYELLLHQYENERLALIQPFVDLGEYELAATLAEKYLDFTTLVRICDATDDEQRLLFYVDKFENKDFAQFLFSWYIREKKQDKLLTQFGSSKTRIMLKNFLVDQPSIAWLHAVFCGDYEYASNILLGLAFQEIESFQRKKYMVNIGKLALLAANCGDEKLFKKVNKEIELLAYQDDLPEVVINAFDLDYTSLKVFLPSELIRFYICDENVSANEYDFIKAVELLDFVDEDLEKNYLRNEIWCKAILRDTWHENIHIEDPVKLANSFLFFKVINFAIDKGIEIHNILPPLEELLLSDDLGTLLGNKTFQFFMNFGYDNYMANKIV